MATTQPELELERNPRFLAIERTVQRIGIGLMTLFMLAGAAGLFGNGVLSTATARAESLAVTYERVTRQSVRSTITIETPSADVARIALDRAFVEQLAIHETRPHQIEMEHGPDQVVFVVPAERGVATLELRVEALHAGIHRTRVTTQDGRSVSLRQIVFF